MEKEIPGWLKNSARELNRLGAPDNKIHISEEVVKPDGWEGLITEITSYVERWNLLQINRIFGDVSEHIFHDEYSSHKNINNTDPNSIPGTIYIQDAFGSSDVLGIPSSNLREVVGMHCKNLRKKGYRPDDFVFGRIENKIFHMEDRGTGDEREVVEVTDYIVSMDKNNLSLSRPTKETLLNIPLESLKTSQDLEADMDVFCAKFIENKRLASERDAAFQTRMRMLVELSQDLQIPSFISAQLGQYEQAFINIDPGVVIKIPETVREWSNNEDMLVIKMTVGIKLLNQSKTERQSLCYVLLTNTGRLGIPLNNGDIQTIDVRSVPAGGRGLQASSQINKDLEDLITNAYKNPPFIRDVPHIEPSR
ncbi:MAG: hypothetical protein UU74_C0013G0016 [Candidatus Woesebacteria bacterium GW2011_GWA1_41_7]|uniref:Uncharacterized protein n=1 Tax=Candidatus Woesebacteria bacterium GW2011_GWA1_41_7 TaxID=1618556 RepID=A0A0G0WYX6_9BACT|nr:MAG: hypothetical protein UU74_C0013G0016 [Candidatus Woesebacteria bacterium GW2011_GWA1_41_7]